MNAHNFPKDVFIKYESSMIETYKDRTVDIRERIENPLEYPFSCIGPVISKQKDGKYYLGSATLIHKRFIITAAHNPYEDSFRAPEFYFAPGYNGQMSDYEYSVGYEFFTFEDIGENIDISVMKLEKPLSDFGTMNLATYDVKRHTNLHFYGYPGDYYKKNLKLQMWGSKVVDPVINNTDLEFSCDSYSGLSGSPIFHYRNSIADLVAIFYAHNYIDNDNKIGYATIINESIISEINKYINENN